MKLSEELRNHGGPPGLFAGKALALEAERDGLRAALIDLVNQIRKCAPTDMFGHQMTMNMAYFEAEKLLAALAPQEPLTEETNKEQK
jgi:hypothetical protein